jgi:RimJ/RimL family protein N-acetyltransferase
MGVDIHLMPTKDMFFSFWKSQLELPVEKRSSYCILWKKNEIPIGHSSTRPTHFGKDAYMHIHLWNSSDRRKGEGYAFLQLTVSHYFQRLQLQDLYCEPYALNPAPNALLEKAHFDLLKEYTTTPGPSNFEQPVKLWHLSRERFERWY